MLEFHLVYVDCYQVALFVAVHCQAVVGLVGKVAGAKDIVHLHPSFATGQCVAIHLAWVRHQYQQAVVL